MEATPVTAATDADIPALGMLPQLHARAGFRGRYTVDPNAPVSAAGPTCLAKPTPL